MTTRWYGKVIGDPGDLTPVLAACEFYDIEYEAAVREVAEDVLRGVQIKELERRMPGIVGYRYAQLQELEAILGYVEIRETAIKGLRRRHYLEHYNRALATTTVEKYVDADDEVLALAMLRNRVALTRNRFVGLSKQLEYLHFNLGNVSKLLAAGVDDAVL